MLSFMSFQVSCMGKLLVKLRYNACTQYYSALMYWPRNRFPVMTERTRLLSDLLYGLFSVILKMSTIKNRNFQHPRVRGHSTWYSLNGNEPGDTIETTRHSFFHEKFWNWARDQLKTTKWSANNFSKNVTWPQWVKHFSLQYSHVIHVSG